MAVPFACANIAACCFSILNPLMQTSRQVTAGPRRCPPASTICMPSNAASRLDQLMAYAGATVQRLLMIANDAFLTEEARRRKLDVVVHHQC